MRAQRIFEVTGALAAIAVAALVVLRPHLGAKHPTRDAVPRETFLAISIDFDRVRASKLTGPLVADESSRLAEVGSLASTCGFDPLARVHAIEIAIPEGGDHGDFGVAIGGDLSAAELVACAKKVLPDHGDRLTTHGSGDFTIASNAPKPDDTSEVRFALRDGGPYIAARGAWLEAMVATAEGKAPSITSSDAHESLRKSLGSHAIVATAILPQELRDRLKREMAPEIEQDKSASPSSEVTMAGVLGVASAGLSIDLGDVNGQTMFTAELHCESDAACDAVAKLIERKRRTWSGDFRARFLGLGGAIDALHVERSGRTLRATTKIADSDLARLLERARGPRRGPTPHLPPRAADERIPAPANSGAHP